jgi:hypothetical protein
MKTRFQFVECRMFATSTWRLARKYKDYSFQNRTRQRSKSVEFYLETPRDTYTYRYGHWSWFIDTYRHTLMYVCRKTDGTCQFPHVYHDTCNDRMNRYDVLSTSPGNRSCFIILELGSGVASLHASLGSITTVKTALRIANARFRFMACVDMAFASKHVMCECRGLDALFVSGRCHSQTSVRGDCSPGVDTSTTSWKHILAPCS